ncbi:uncharacterized protein [Mycetomoellerius zeteki]|uniref:uncharacterized protein n=1 Tax=Mycetomoellerius zeteki TaxID=64791 RepID=UPI00084EA1C3|nr:PREDICTED: uncharacterized protein LOC108731879 [Trachymyrmex zeteki]
MHVLKLTRTICMITGCFRPQSWTSLFKRIIYDIYRLYVISIICTFTFSQIMDIVMNVDNPNDFTNNLNMMLNMSASCYKFYIVSSSYKNIVALINYLTEEPFKPLDLGEIKIRRQYDKIIRNNTLRYAIMILTAWTFMTLMSLLTNFRHRKLTYRGWIPYDYSSYIKFCLTYSQQLLSTFHGASINIAGDTLLCGLLMHICCQIEILEYRLKKHLCDQFSLGYCIRHHNRIFEFAQMVNTRFTQIIGFQFMASTMVTCFNLYQLTKSTLNVDHFALIMYTCATLIQIFVYCWFGNKVKLKSLHLTDSIFQMEWPVVENSVKKDILIIMKRAMIPIEITTIHILIINLDSFVAVIMNIILNINNFGEISDNIYMTLTVFIATYKITTMWIIKEHVITIINVITEEPFKPSELCEVIIRQKHDKTIKKYAVWCYGLIQVTVICIILNAIFMDFIEGNLTYKAWVPFDYTSSIIFLLVFTHQMIGMSICAAVNLACDCLLSGLLQEICCQFEILEYRLTKILHEKHILRDCVRHHNRIYEYAHIINRRFAKIIALQFAVSMLVVCANLYKLAAISLLMMNGSLVTLLLYTACMLSQIFLYCWFGNELKLKSTGVANSIYNMKWQELDNESTKSLLLIMRRSMIPIEFNSVIVITLNLDSFVAVSMLKINYIQYAYTVNNMFAKIIAIQFAVSMLVVCSNLYRIAMATNYVSFIPLIMYTSAILVQIFIYCWFGNEIKLKSLQLINNIYDIEWLALSNSNKKILLLMMKRAMTPIEFTSGYIITMNLESFVALLKMSYSAFNLLHQTQD